MKADQNGAYQFQTNVALSRVIGWAGSGQVKIDGSWSSDTTVDIRADGK